MSTPINRFLTWLDGGGDTLLDRSLLASQTRPADEDVYPETKEHLVNDEEEAREEETVARRLTD